MSAGNPVELFGVPGQLHSQQPHQPVRMRQLQLLHNGYVPRWVYTRKWCMCRWQGDDKWATEHRYVQHHRCCLVGILLSIQTLC